MNLELPTRGTHQSQKELGESREYLPGQILCNVGHHQRTWSSTEVSLQGLRIQ
jgi:hypothetical protein